MTDIQQFEARGYATRLAEPFVARELHRVSRTFECNPIWTGSMGDLVAAELPTDARAGFGYGRRGGAAMDVRAHGEAVLTEHCYPLGSLFDDEELTSLPKGGRVVLDVAVNANLEVPNSIEVNMAQEGVEDVPGLMCWAQEYKFRDATCVCLRTCLGEVWILPIAKHGHLSLSYGLLYGEVQPVRSASKIFHIAQAEYVLREPVKRWQYLSSMSTSGRQWHIDAAKLVLGVSLKQEVGSRNYPFDLRERRAEAIVLRPPYDVVWRPVAVDDTPSPYVFLTME